MTIHGHGKPNSGLLATGHIGNAVKHELRGLDFERKVDEIILVLTLLAVAASAYY